MHSNEKRDPPPEPNRWAPVVAHCRSVLAQNFVDKKSVDTLIDLAIECIEVNENDAKKREQSKVARALLSALERAQDYAICNPRSDIANLLKSVDATGLCELAKERPAKGKTPDTRPVLLAWFGAVKLGLSDQELGALALLIEHAKSDGRPPKSRLRGDRGEPTPAQRLREEARAFRKARKIPWVIEARRQHEEGKKAIAPLVTTTTHAMALGAYFAEGWLRRAAGSNTDLLDAARPSPLLAASREHPDNAPGVLASIDLPTDGEEEDLPGGVGAEMETNSAPRGRK